jgi:hypothetical protein
MEALDPIDVMRIATGYYTELAEEEQARHSSLVVLFSGNTDNVDLTASRDAYVSVLREQLENEFPKAAEIEIRCLDGEPPRTGATQVSLTREDQERLRVATAWVDALAMLTWAQGRWIAPAMSA